VDTASEASRADTTSLLAVRHPLSVVLLGIALGILAFTAYPPGPDAVLAALLCPVLVVVAAIDVERRVIPNIIVLPAATLVLVAHVALFPNSSSEYVLAALGAAAAFLVPNLISRSLMGMGDVKLALLLGAALGASVVGAITLAFLSLFPFALAVLIRGGLKARKATLPFGPFLVFGALVVLIVPRFVA
jgi:leader peptidase (prepilin peptidase)/N-methyltransferase